MVATSRDEEVHQAALDPSLERALQGCLAQLRALRAVAAATGSEESPTASTSGYADEERALKLSLAVIIAQLQVVREQARARRRSLFLAVAPHVLQLLSTVSVLRLGGCSLRVCAAIGHSCAGSLLIPNLDAAPDGPTNLESLLKRLDLAAVRSLALPLAATQKLVSERQGELGALEALAIPAGFQNFAMLAANPGVAALRHLSVRACALTPQGANEMAQLLASLSRPLSSLQIDALEPILATGILDVVLLQGVCKTRRLVFSRCVLPDVTVAKICCALLDGHGVAGVAAGGACRAGTILDAVSFEECELSELAEQRLGLVLENCDGHCIVTMDGGTTRPSHRLNDDVVPEAVWPLATDEIDMEYAEPRRLIERMPPAPQAKESSFEERAIAAERRAASAERRLKTQSVTLREREARLAEQDAELCILRGAVAVQQLGMSMIAGDSSHSMCGPTSGCGLAAGTQRVSADDVDGTGKCAPDKTAEEEESAGEDWLQEWRQPTSASSRSRFGFAFEGGSRDGDFEGVL